MTKATRTALKSIAERYQPVNARPIKGSGRIRKSERAIAEALGRKRS